QLDPVPPHLHLPVSPSCVFDPSVAPVSPAVSCVIHHLSCLPSIYVRYKYLRRLSCLLHVPSSYSFSSYIYLPVHSDRRHSSYLIRHVYLRVYYWPPYRHHFLFFLPFYLLVRYVI